MYKKHSSGLRGLESSLKKERQLLGKEDEFFGNNESQSSGKPKKITTKCMKYLQKVKEIYEDLITKHTDTEEMFSVAVQQQGDTEPDLISKIAALVNKLEVLAKDFPKIEEKIDSYEGEIYQIENKELDGFRKKILLGLIKK